MAYNFAYYGTTTYALSKKPKPTGETDTSEDTVIRSPAEGGYVQTRARFTRVRMQWTLPFSMLTATDKSTLESLYTAVNGSDYFTYYHYSTGTTYTVRFTKPLQFDVEANNHWRITIELEQV